MTATGRQHLIFFLLANHQSKDSRFAASSVPHGTLPPRISTALPGSRITLGGPTHLEHAQRRFSGLRAHDVIADRGAESGLAFEAGVGRRQQVGGKSFG